MLDKKDLACLCKGLGNIFKSTATSLWLSYVSSLPIYFVFFQFKKIKKHLDFSFFFFFAVEWMVSSAQIFISRPRYQVISWFAMIEDPFLLNIVISDTSEPFIWVDHQVLFSEKTFLTEWHLFLKALRFFLVQNSLAISPFGVDGNC